MPANHGKNLDAIRFCNVDTNDPLIMIALKHVGMKEQLIGDAPLRRFSGPANVFVRLVLSGGYWTITHSSNPDGPSNRTVGKKRGRENSVPANRTVGNTRIPENRASANSSTESA